MKIVPLTETKRILFGLRSFFKNFGAVLKLFNDLYLLRTGTLALSAGYAVGSLSRPADSL